MTSGPAARLLAAFCALAETWLDDEPRKVDCASHGGRFDAGELARFRLAAPAVRAACLGIASAREDGEGSVILDFRLAAVTVAAGRNASRRGKDSRRLAERIAFELALDQQSETADGQRAAWPLSVFGAAALEDAYPGGPRGCDIGDPREIRAANLYSGKLDGKGVALWAVTWLQQLRARPEDFALPAAGEGEIPETVKSGFDPEIGIGHEGDYEQVVPEEAST